MPDKILFLKLKNVVAAKSKERIIVSDWKKSVKPRYFAKVTIP